MKTIARTKLTRIGHDCLSALVNESADGLLRLTPEYAITAEQAIGAGVLAALLLIHEDISGLVAIQNMARLAEEL